MKTTVGDIPAHIIQVQDKLFASTGPTLRKYSLDELPQIFNIIKGDIAFIGPRPATSQSRALDFPEKLNNILEQKPGITG